jgi:hypothetical protein
MRKPLFFVVAIAVPLFFSVSGAQAQFAATCPAESLYGVPPLPLETPAVAASDAFRPYRRFERFFDVAEPIGEVRWWGTLASLPDNESCTRTFNEYAIRFFGNVGGVPGTLIYEEIVAPEVIDTGETVGGVPGYEFRAVLSQPVSAAQGWVGISGETDSECSFVWYGGTGDNDAHVRQEEGNPPEASPQNTDLSLCLLPVPAAEGEPEGEGEGTTEGEAAGCGTDIEDSGGFAGCLVGSLASQPPSPLESAQAGVYGSDTGTNDLRLENFSGVTAPIYAVRWWGVGAKFGSPCERNPGAFRIAFFQDGGGSPSTLVSEQVVTPSRTDTGAVYNPYPIYQFEANLEAPVNLSGGWLSIHGVDNDDCYFYWYRSDVGDIIHYRDQGVQPLGFGGGNLSFCLLPCVVPLPTPEGDGEIEGSIEGNLEGEGEGISDGEGEGEGLPEGEGEGSMEGEGEGGLEGEGGGEDEGEGEDLPIDCELEEESEHGEFAGCTALTLSSQPPSPIGSLEAGVYGSDTSFPDVRTEDFSGVNAPIQAVRWWGTALASGVNCDRTPHRFRIAFYEGPVPLPVALVSEQTLIASVVATGESVGNFTIYQYEANLAAPVDLESGWLSIHGVDSDGCSFYWYRSDVGDSSHYRDQGGPSLGFGGGNLSYCLLPCPVETPDPEGELEGEGEGDPIEGEEGEPAEGEGEITEGEDEEGEGELEEGEGEGEGEGESPLVLEACPAGSLAAFPPASPNSINAGVYGSDFGLNDQRAEYFSGAAAPIAAVRWWGTGISASSGLSCARTPNRYLVRFYEGSNNFARGVLVSEQEVTATQEPTGVVVNNRDIYRHRADLTTPVSLESGWLSIQGIDDVDCRFYWYRTDSGSGAHIRFSESATSPSAGGNLSYCLLPDFEPLPGHSADYDGNPGIALSELLRAIQLFNAAFFQCGPGSEDGFALGTEDRDCPPHAGDYNPRDWRFSLSELLRLIQFFASGGFRECPDTEDGFCAGPDI